MLTGFVASTLLKAKLLAEQEVGDGFKLRNGIKSRWEKYKKDFAATQVSTLHFSIIFASYPMVFFYYPYLRLLS